MKRWFSEDSDIRENHSVHKEILEFILKEKARSLAITDSIIGCPHEEGIDYPDRLFCPKCPYWIDKEPGPELPITNNNLHHP